MNELEHCLHCRPWYREPWPWILMAGPFAVIVAGLFTAWMAVTRADPLVVDNYYKEGLAINQVIERDQAAAHGRLPGGGDVRTERVSRAPASGWGRLASRCRATLDGASDPPGVRSNGRDALAPGGLVRG